MTTFLITRHLGAAEWAALKGLRVDHTICHFDPEKIQPDDLVIGTLPVNLAAAVCARGARFLNLSLDLPVQMRGKELSAADLDRYGARIDEYRVERIAC